MKIAQHQRLRDRAGLCECGAPAFPVIGSPGRPDGHADGRQVPVEQVFRLGEEEVVRIGGEAGRHRGGGSEPVERDQGVDGEIVERRLVLAACQQPGEGVVAQILHQQQPGRAVRRGDPGRAEPEAAQMAGDRRIRRDGLAVGRGVHQDGGFDAAADPQIAAEGGIGGERCDRGARPARAGEKTVDLAATRGTGQASLRSARATPARRRSRPPGHPPRRPGGE